jgi:hypothetical protein
MLQRNKLSSKKGLSMQRFEEMIDPRLAGVAVALVMTLIETGLIITALAL